jgi:2'-5' RNA ligase
VSGATKRRLFLAVDLDTETRHLLAACLAEHLEMSPLWKPVHPKNWHVTLRFLGWTTEVQRDLVMMHLAEQLDAESFGVRFGGLGAFPKPRKATVLWMGVDDGDRLDPIAAAAESAAVAAGFAPDDRPYHAHLTLARIRPQADVREILADFDACGIGFGVSAVTMYESFVEPGGTRYEPIDRLPLRPTGWR